MKRALPVFASVGLSFAASAADLPQRVAPPAPAPVFVQHNWAGFYVGVNAGYGWSDVKIRERTQNLAPLTFTPDFVPQGGIGGIQAGYNFQSDRLVFGIEVDGSLSDISARASAPTQFTGLSYTLEGNLKWLVTGRLRLGYDMGAFLPYITGGVAVGKVDRIFSNSIPQSFSSSQTHIGWTVGIGSEYALTPNLLARVEGLYVDLGKKTYGTFSPSDVTPSGFIVRGGLSYKFGSASKAVVARY